MLIVAIFLCILALLVFWAIVLGGGLFTFAKITKPMSTAAVAARTRVEPEIRVARLSALHEESFPDCLSCRAACKEAVEQNEPVRCRYQPCGKLWVPSPSGRV